MKAPPANTIKRVNGGAALEAVLKTALVMVAPAVLHPVVVGNKSVVSFVDF